MLRHWDPENSTANEHIRQLYNKGWISVSEHWDDKKGATRMTSSFFLDPSSQTTRITEEWDDRNGV
ncbi:MAG: WPE palindromic element domain-containing protein [Wolbachia pipientis]